MEQNLTRVRTIDMPHVKSVWIRFGKYVHQEPKSATQKVSYFVPDSRFALVRWHGNAFGTILYQLSVLRAVAPQQAAAKVADVAPGAEVLLRVSATENIRWVLSLIRKIESLGIDPAEVNPNYWHCVHNRLSARIAVPEYNLAEHSAYLRRVALIS